MFFEEIQLMIIVRIFSVFFFVVSKLEIGKIVRIQLILSTDHFQEAMNKGKFSQLHL